MDLVLPWIHHRVDALQYLTATYNNRTTPTLEEPALGVIALAGVVALLVIMVSTLVPQRVKPADRELKVFALFTLAAISFFSIGGLGSFFALFVTPQIRTWSRLFVIIGLFGLLAVGHWVSVVGRRNRILGLLTATALIAIGVLDQTNPALAPNYKALRTEIADLSAFSQRISTKVGPGCSVFQLPVVPYPENPQFTI
jgi:MFS family permease